MQSENMSEDKHLKKDRIFGDILFCEEKIQIYAYGPDTWVDDLVETLDSLGIKLEEQFRSPCG